MQISFQQTVPFENLKIGDTFIWDKNLYLRIEAFFHVMAGSRMNINALNLNTFKISSVSDDMQVIPVDSELSCSFKEKDRFSY